MDEPTGPMRNRFWAAMAATDRDALASHLRYAEMERGDVVTTAGSDVHTVFFPVTADLANIVRLEDGRAAMATNVGRDGVSGLAAFLAREPMGWDIEVELSGAAYALPAAVLRRQAEARPELQQLLLRLTHANQIEAAQNTVCNAVHPATARIARWFLTTQDRTSQTVFVMRQEDMARLLAMQRTTVNAVWAALKAAGAIRSRRERVEILNRQALKRLACECYATLAGLRLDTPNGGGDDQAD